MLTLGLADVWIGGIFGLVGIIVGGLIAPLTTAMLDKRKQEAERKDALREAYLEYLQRFNLSISLGQLYYDIATNFNDLGQRIERLEGKLTPEQRAANVLPVTVQTAQWHAENTYRISEIVQQCGTLAGKIASLDHNLQRRQSLGALTHRLVLIVQQRARIDPADPNKHVELDKQLQSIGNDVSQLLTAAIDELR